MRISAWAPKLCAMAASGLILMVAAGCGSGDENTGSSAPDVSHAGQVAYACALASHIDAEHGDAESWSTLVGDDANPGAREAAAVAGLLGAAAGYTLDEHETLSDLGTDVFDGVVRADTPTLQEGLNGIEARCDDTSEELDVSHDGQITYACALTDHIDHEHGQPSSWGGIDEDPGWHEAASVAAFAGGLNGQVLPEHPDLSQAAKQIFQASTRLKVDLLSTGLDEFASACD